MHTTGDTVGEQEVAAIDGNSCHLQDLQLLVLIPWAFPLLCHTPTQPLLVGVTGVFAVGDAFAVVDATVAYIFAVVDISSVVIASVVIISPHCTCFDGSLVCCSTW